MKTETTFQRILSLLHVAFGEMKRKNILTPNYTVHHMNAMLIRSDCFHFKSNKN